MELLYEDYWNATFVIPASIIAFMSVLLLLAIVGLIKEIKKKRPGSWIVGSLISVIMPVAFIYLELIPIINGGFWLLSETETDAVTKVGVIESVCEPSEVISIKSNHRYGADIVIDGERYFAITAGEFKEGDVVEVKYLPQSCFVLGISYSDG